MCCIWVTICGGLLKYTLDLMLMLIRISLKERRCFYDWFVFYIINGRSRVSLMCL